MDNCADKPKDFPDHSNLAKYSFPNKPPYLEKNIDLYVSYY